MPDSRERKCQKLRDAPRDVDFFCVNCGSPNACLAHLNYRDAGMAQKTYDVVGAHLCKACHDFADGPDGRMDHEFRFRVLSKTLIRLWRKGVIGCLPS